MVRRYNIRAAGPVKEDEGQWVTWGDHSEAVSRLRQKADAVIADERAMNGLQVGRIKKAEAQRDEAVALLKMYRDAGEEDFDDSDPDRVILSTQCGDFLDLIEEKTKEWRR